MGDESGGLMEFGSLVVVGRGLVVGPFNLSRSEINAYTRSEQESVVPLQKKTKLSDADSRDLGDFFTADKGVTLQSTSIQDWVKVNVPVVLQ